jgi:hypothetical protein
MLKGHNPDCAHVLPRSSGPLQTWKRCSFFKILCNEDLEKDRFTSQVQYCVQHVDSHN